MATRGAQLRALDLGASSSGAGPAAPSTSAIWTPVTSGSVPRVPTTTQVLQQARPPAALPAEIEAEILATLTRPLPLQESHYEGNGRRERDLGQLFSTLDVIQSHELGRRLDIDRPDDSLAHAFRRLIPERRLRLRIFLGDARRRVARNGR